MPSSPASVCSLITPMNFIYGIPGIQLVACYLSGSPLIFKGHPFAAITSTTLVKMLLAAGADPRAVHKIEGFGGDVSPIVRDERIAVVSVTGSVETAQKLQSARGVRPVRFEGGGCNWAWIDDGFSDADLEKIAVRLAYAKLGFGAHKSHEPARNCGEPSDARPHRASHRRRRCAATEIADPRNANATEAKVVSPLMVHKAATVTSIQEAARAAGVSVLLEGGKVTGSPYADHAEVAAPVVLSRIGADARVAALD